MFHELEVILGFDWLIENNVLLDYGNKRIIYPTLQKDVNANVDLNFLSVAQDGKCLHKGHQGYFVFFSIEVEVEMTIEDIHVANKFLKVFPKDK